MGPLLSCHIFERLILWLVNKYSLVYFCQWWKFGWEICSLHIHPLHHCKKGIFLRSSFSTNKSSFHIDHSSPVHKTTKLEISIIIKEEMAIGQPPIPTSPSNLLKKCVGLLFSKSYKQNNNQLFNISKEYIYIHTQTHLNILLQAFWQAIVNYLRQRQASIALTVKWNGCEW